MIRLLHISDLHASRDSEVDRRRLVEAMIADVEAQIAEAPVDLVVISGDLADRGTQDEYSLVTEMLIDPLLSRLGLGADQLILVPGNHDVNRDRISRVTEIGLRGTLSGRDALEQLLDSPDELAEATRRLWEWEAFRSELAGKPENSQTFGGLSDARTLDINGTSLGLALLNSAWRSSGNGDRGRLLLGGRHVDEALDAIGDCDVRLVVCHHPLDWMAGFELDHGLREFEIRGLIVLSGHEHEPKPRAQKSPRGETVFLQAGCLYEHVEFPNSYFLVDIDPGERQLRVAIREWYEDRGAFDEATRIAENGSVVFPLPRPGAAKDLGHPTPSTVMRLIARQAAELRMLPDDLAGDGQPVSVEELLISPRFLSIPYKEARAAATFDEGVSGKEVDAVEELLETNVLLVCGESQSGVSSALLWLLSSVYRRDGERMPAYMATRDSAFGRAKEGASLTKAAALFGYSQATGAPALSLAIDDVDAASEKKASQMVAHMAANSQHRYILGCSEDEWQAIAGKLDDAGVKHSRVHLPELGRRDLRELVKTVNPTAETEVERIYQLLQTQNLPRNPFTMIALIAVLEASNTDATDLNETSLLRAFVRLLLGGDELIDTERLGMDYVKRVHILGELAHRLHRSDEFSIPVQEVERFMLGYFEARALQVSSGAVLQSLISRGVLVQRNEQIAFRHPALLSLFLAEWMLIDEAKAERMEELLADCRRNGDALVHAAAITRDRATLLESVGDYASEIIDNVMSRVPLEMVDELLAKSDSSPPWDGDRLGKALERMPARKSDAELDLEIDRISDAVASIDAQDSPLLEAIEEIRHATALLSDVLKSSELVDNIDLKRQMLELALRGWVMVIGIVIAEDAREESMRDVIAASIDEINPEEAEQLTQLLLLFATMVISVATYVHLGTRHLAATIEAVLEDEEFSKSPTAVCFAVWLQAQLEIREATPRLGRLLADLPAGSSLHNATMGVLVSQYRMTGDEKRAEGLRDVLVAHTQTDLGQGRGAPRQRELQRQQVKARLVRSRRSYQAGIRLEVSATEAIDVDALPDHQNAT